MARKQDTRTVKAAGRKKSGKGEEEPAKEPGKPTSPAKGKAAKEPKARAAKAKSKAPKIAASRKPASPAVRMPVSLATSPAGGKGELKQSRAQAKELVAETGAARLPTGANMRILADEIAGMLDHPEGRARLAELLVYLAQHLTRA